jgi:protein SCO1/2
MAEMNRRKLLAGLTLAPLGLALGSKFSAAGDERSATQRTWAKPTGTYASRNYPNVEVISHEGKKFHFYDDLIKDRMVLINFFYSQCKEFCPPMTANLVKVQDRLGERLGRDLFMYSLTLEPQHDTPEVLRHYSMMYGTKPGWSFLTGKPENLEALRIKLGFRDLDPVEDADRSNHTGVILYGNDKLNRWSACPALASIDEIMRQISSLDPGPQKPFA